MVLTNDEKLAMSTAILQGNTFKKGDVLLFPLAPGEYCVQKMAGSVTDENSRNTRHGERPENAMRRSAPNWSVEKPPLKANAPVASTTSVLVLWTANMPAPASQKFRTKAALLFPATTTSRKRRCLGEEQVGGPI